MQKCTYILLLTFSFYALPCQAQFHFKGLKGLGGEMGMKNSLDQHYRLSYHTFLSNKFQLELSAAYEQGAYSQLNEQDSFKLYSQYHIKSLALHQSIHLSLFKLFNSLYINLGAGLSQAYQVPELVYLRYQVHSDINQEPINYNKQHKLKDGFSLGGHASLLAELYLCRYISLTGRYQLTYFLKNHYDQSLQHSSIGLRLHFQ